LKEKLGMGMAQVVEHLSSMREVLSPMSSTEKERKEEEERKQKRKGKIVHKW
jgi:hypothetical protein